MPDRPSLPPRAVAGGFSAFVLIGVLQSMYGPAIPGLRDRFALSEAAAGLVLSAHFAGALSGIAVTGLFERRVAPRWRLTGAAGCLAVGGAGLALAPAYGLTLGAAYVIGLGFGTIDLGFSTLFAAGFGRRSTAMSNLLHACFGIGAVLGPVAIGLSGGESFRLPLLVAAGFAFALAPLTLGVPRVTHAGAVHREASGTTARRSGNRAVLAGFVALFALYVGTETSVGGWEPTHLVENGYSESRAASLTALFWGSIMVGRLLAAPLSLRVPPRAMVLGSLAASAAFLSLAHVATIAPAAYALTGLAFAPFFPTGMVWLMRTLPSTRGATAFVVAGANLGAVIIPAVVGALITATTAAVVPTVLTAGALTTLAAGVALRWGSSHSGTARAAAPG